MKIEVSLLAEWYLPHKRGKPLTDSEKSDYYAQWDRLIDQLADCETGLVLRDFHSPNLIWQPQNSGIRQVGLIDFQDAMIGPTAYDVASIVQDARVTISPNCKRACFRTISRTEEARLSMRPLSSRLSPSCRRNATASLPVSG